MAGTSNIHRIGERSPISWLAGSCSALPHEVRRELANTVRGNVPIFLAGLFGTIAMSAAIAWRNPSAPFVIWAGLTLLIGVARASLLLLIARPGQASDRIEINRLAVGMSLSWAATVGYGAFICMMSGDWVAATLACMSAGALAGVVSFRFCALPRLAAFMIGLSLGPCALGALFSGEPIVVIFAPLIPIYAVTMAMAAFQVHRLLVHGLLTEREMERRVRHDALTGLLNRAGLASELAQRAARHDRFALLYLDLDGFRNVNDNCGHQIGDELLKAVAERLRAACAPGDTIARVGIDEFVILSTASDTAAAQVVGERFIAAIGNQDSLSEGEAAFAGVSVGVAVCPDHGKDLGSLLGEADAALYQAKYGGRARCVVARTGRTQTPEAERSPVERSVAPIRGLDRDAA